jgi:cysteine synthase A
MMLQPTFDNAVDALVLPRVVRLDDRLHGAAFTLMKLLPARFILDRAADAGLLRPGSVVIETTSGTFGLALAMLCALRGYRFLMVSDPAIDPPLQRRLEDLGAQVDIVRKPAAMGGIQRARLDRVAELQAQHPDHFWPSQYDNPHNPGAYGPVAELLAETAGRIDCLVGTVGSGGSMCGTAKFLRLLFPHLHTIGVDTHGSVLFGQPDNKRLLRGLGNSLMPRNLDHTDFDEVHWVSAAEAFLATRTLHHRSALYMGGTSGAAYLVAQWWIRHNPKGRAVVLLPDEGYRYQDTIYNDQWLQESHLWQDTLPDAPVLVEHPAAAATRWARYQWRRRRYAEVMGAPFSGEVTP